jgi:hypothetical protein
MNRTDLQDEIKNALNFKYNEKNILLKQYIADYLGINLYIIHVENNLININNCECYISKYYGDEINKFLPTLLIIYCKEIYNPILTYKKELNDSSILVYSKNKEIIDNLLLYFNDIIYNLKHNLFVNNLSNSEYNIEMLNNLKIDSLKKLCIKNDIEIQKVSEKTSKMINKVKSELINDLLNI